MREIMSTKKTKKERKKSRRAEEDAQREAEIRSLERRQRYFRIAAISFPIVTAVLAVSAYFALDDKRAAAIIVGIGVALWLPALLGSLGASIRPRDRLRAGSIDFGQRRR
jgi:hypothetical protein